MSSYQPNRRETIRLDKVPRSSTPEPAAERPRTSRPSTTGRAAVVDPSSQATHSDPELDWAAFLDPSTQATPADMELDRAAVVDLSPQATPVDPELNRAAPADPAMERAALADSALHRAVRADPASRDTSAMEPQVEEPEEGPGEAAIDGSRVTRRPSHIAGGISPESVENPHVTSWTLPADAISTGVDSGVMPPAMMEKMAWDAWLP